MLLAEKAEWGWVTYKRTPWVNEKGEKLYQGHLRADNDPSHYTDIHVDFYTKTPVKKLRAACSKPRTSHEVIEFLQN